MQKKLRVLLIIAMMLLLSFLLMFMCAKYSLKLMATFPEVACNGLPLNESPEALERVANREWTMNKVLEEKGAQVTYFGYV